MLFKDTYLCFVAVKEFAFLSGDSAASSLGTKPTGAAFPRPEVGTVGTQLQCLGYAANTKRRDTKLLNMSTLLF